MNYLKLQNYSADCCNHIGHICLLFLQPPPAPPHIYQDTFGRLKGDHFARYQMRQHQRIHI